MCTVSFVPGSGEYLLCSSRDEQVRRDRARHPKVYKQPGGSSLIYPLDPRGKGSWITLTPRGEAMILLNGAFFKHEPLTSYKKSRGLILLEIADSPDPMIAFNAKDLDGIEPFTLVLFREETLHECRWDGVQKYVRALDHRQPHIWSSVTLYEEPVRAQREEWFRDWLERHPQAQASDLLQFHAYTMENDRENGLVIKRESGVCTQSISLLRLTPSRSEFHYLDLLQKTTRSTGFVRELKSPLLHEPC